MDRHADRLSWQPTFAIRYPAVFAGDKLPLLEVMEGGDARMTQECPSGAFLEASGRDRKPAPGVASAPASHTSIALGSTTDWSN